MRILIANSFYYPRGGDCVHVLALERLLQKRGHEVAILAMQHPDNLLSPWEPYWPANVEYRRAAGHRADAALLLASLWSADAKRRARRLIADFAPDIVHLHSIHHHLTASVISAAVDAGLAIVWTLHDYRTVCPATHLLRGGRVCRDCGGGAYQHCLLGRCKGGSLGRSLAVSAESFLTRRRGLLGAIDCYIAPSRFLARTVLSMGLPAQHIEVLQNFLPEESEDTADTSRRGQRTGVLYVGRLSPEKGVEVLLRAWAHRKDATLVIVGDGPERPVLERLASKLHSQAEFRGWLSPADARNEIAGAALVCIPSTCYENCPLVALEAMACKTPLIVSDIGGLPELVASGRCGWTVPAGSSEALRATIDDVLGDPVLAATKTSAALAKVRRLHSATAYIEKLEPLYGRLVSRRAGTQE